MEKHYFDYQMKRFVKNIKWFSTPRGCTIFLSMKGVEAKELWSHGRRVHVFFPREGFMDETELFYSKYLKYLRKLEEMGITDPNRCFYLHFLGESEEEKIEQDAFYRYLVSATKSYLNWRFMFHRMHDEFVDTENGPRDSGLKEIYSDNMIQVVRHPFRGVNFTMERDRIYYAVEPDYKKGIYDLDVILNIDGWEEHYYLSENRDQELMFQKVKRKKQINLSREQTFALSLIKNYMDPTVAHNLIGDYSNEDLLEFVTRQGKYSEYPEGSKERNFQNALNTAYECFLKTYELMDEDSVSRVLIAEGVGNDDE